MESTSTKQQNNAIPQSSALQQNELPEAELSYDVAIIPTQPLKDQIKAASLAISKQMDNHNIIDNEKFPAHISLYLGGTDRVLVSSLCEQLKSQTMQFKSTQLNAEYVYGGGRGFVGLECVFSPALKQLMQTVIDVCGRFHRQNPKYRPHLIERWPRLYSEQQDLLVQHGTYKTIDNARPHLSIASVQDEYINEAKQIAQQYILTPQEFGIEAIQVVDVGHNNEKWEVLCTWSAGS